MKAGIPQITWFSTSRNGLVLTWMSRSIIYSNLESWLEKFQDIYNMVTWVFSQMDLVRI